MSKKMIRFEKYDESLQEKLNFYGHEILGRVPSLGLVLSADQVLSTDQTKKQGG